MEADSSLVEGLLGLGRVLMAERRFTDAVTNFQAVQASVTPDEGPVGGRPYALEAKLGEIRAQLELGDTAAALSGAQTIAQANPDDADVQLVYGQSLMASESYETAGEVFARVVELAPTNFDGYIAQANLAFAQEDPDAAAAALQAAREHVEMNAQVRVALGDAEMRRGNHRAAEAEYRAALRADDEFVVAYFGLGRALRHQGRLDAAEGAFTELGQRDPHFPGLALERGRIFEARGQAAEAVTFYRRALEQRPEDLDLKLSLAGALVVAGQTEEAEPLLREIRTARENSATAEYYTGRMYFVREEYDAALRHLELACRLDARAAEHQLYRGWTQLRMNSLARANEAVQSAIHLDPELGDAYFVRGQILLRTGHAVESVADFQRAIELRPDRTENLAGLADALDQVSRREPAIQLYAEAVRRDPSHGQWWYRLGALRFDEGDRAGALEALAQATELGDTHEMPPGWLAEAHRLSGEAARLGGDTATAIAHFERFLALAPPTNFDREDVERVLRELRDR